MEITDQLSQTEIKTELKANSLNFKYVFLYPIWIMNLAKLGGCLDGALNKQIILRTMQLGLKNLNMIYWAKRPILLQIS